MSGARPVTLIVFSSLLLGFATEYPVNTISPVFTFLSIVNVFVLLSNTAPSGFFVTSIAVSRDIFSPSVPIMSTIYSYSSGSSSESGIAILSLPVISM